MRADISNNQSFELGATQRLRRPGLVAHKALIYQGELEYMSRVTLDSLAIETGGDLFGFWTHSGAPVVQYVIGPGPRANRRVAFFNQDLEFLRESGRILRKWHGLQHIGQWHSHHQLGLDEPSGHDCATIHRAVHDYDLGRFLLVIGVIRQGRTAFRGFLFSRGQNGHDEVRWVVLPGENPVRSDLRPKLGECYCEPRTPRAALGEMELATLDDGTIRRHRFAPGSWLSHAEGQKCLKRLLELVETNFGSASMFLGQHGQVFLRFRSKGQGVTLEFSNDFPKTAVAIAVDDRRLAPDPQAIGSGHAARSLDGDAQYDYICQRLQGESQ
jgi:hypothetical protein